jgi:hypothetical protein
MVLRIFTPQWKIAWFAQLTLITLMEITPFHSEHVPSEWFYTYQLSKCLVFWVLGWQTAVAFQSYSASLYALLSALGCSAGVEAMQNLVFGHRFSLVELGGKLAIICIGFTLGLVSVHDHRVSFFTKHVDLLWGAIRSRQSEGR